VQDHSTGSRLGADLHGAARRRLGDGIVDEVVEHSCHQPEIVVDLLRDLGELVGVCRDGDQQREAGQAGAAGA